MNTLKFLPYLLLFLACGSRSIRGSASEAVIDPMPVEVTSPRPNEQISSPLLVIGRARGSWFFEADFPMKLVTEEGYILATGYASAEGDWMTEEFVPFTGTLDFSGSDPESGFLVLERANPSGLPEQADSLRIVVGFNPPR